MLTVTGLRTQAELRGISCHPFADMPSSRKSIACTRSFGRAVTGWDDMREAVATYASRAGEKLRRFGLYAGAMQVFMRTNEFNNDPRYANQATFEIEATADSRALIIAAHGPLRACGATDSATPRRACCCSIFTAPPSCRSPICSLAATRRRRAG